nr:swi/snf chromatin-remodeling complex subunit sol1 [Quercus suber]
MPNGSSVNPGQFNAQQQHQMKRAAFLKQLMAQAQTQGRSFNPSPTIGGRPVDLYMLWTFVTQLGGSASVEAKQQWQALASKMGFVPPQFANAAEEMRQLFAQTLGTYERVWLSVRSQHKQEQARMHAQQMAGLGPAQASPTRPMQPPNPQNQPPQATPVQAHAHLAQNGSMTPQQQQQQQQMAHHRRGSSSLRRPDPMTAPLAHQATMAPSPRAPPDAHKLQSPSMVKTQPAAPVMKSDEVQSTNYVPHVRSIEMDGGYDMSALYDLGTTIMKSIPNMPSVDEMGVIDTKAIMLSLASGLHAEVRYALDMLAIVSNDTRIQFDLEKCEDLLDVMVDCAEEQTDLLSEDAVEVSDAPDLPSYEDILRGAKIEADSLQEIAVFGTPAYELDRAADKLIAITTVLRNFSFYEFNHRLLTSAPLIRWLCNTIRLLGTRNMLLRTHYNTQDFYKDMITFLSNVTQSLELHSRDDALHVLHFLLAFAPQPAPSYVEEGGRLRFASFIPTVHRYLPPAVDCLAKLLARQDPNRMLYKSIFAPASSAPPSFEVPLDLVTRAFALAISVLPDRSKGGLGNTQQLRIVEARKAYLSQGMLAADILTTLAPSGNADLARAWIESEDGWAVGLLNLAALLSVDRSATVLAKGQIGHDTETFKLISHRALAMMKRLTETAGKGGDATRRNPTHGTAAAAAAINGDVRGEVHTTANHLPGWEGIPQSHAILGALMMPQSDRTSLGLLCNMYDLAAREEA